MLRILGQHVFKVDYSSGCFPETMEETEMNMERPSHPHYAVPVPFLALSSRASRVASIRTVHSAAVGKIDVIFVLCQLPTSFVRHPSPR